MFEGEFSPSNSPRGGIESNQVPEAVSGDQNREPEYLKNLEQIKSAYKAQFIDINRKKLA
ncbi:hypothetical protein GCM10011520_00770 [Shewanella carassii]|uniref:Uncharacterized protein n=1 Tax=Shewanella carassii TaxID=1987584 RepID=A0ABQ1SU33_9GAMM|nr:hypothetical protein GCM10011520_00770 [Shewanella carassii]